MSASIQVESVLLDIRRPDGSAVEDVTWASLGPDHFMETLPWRMFRWFHGQKHYSGAYWSATTRDHVIYESRLEPAHLLLADFDSAVRHIVAQPFLLKAKFGGQVRSGSGQRPPAAHGRAIQTATAVATWSVTEPCDGPVELQGASRSVRRRPAGS